MRRWCLAGLQLVLDLGRDENRPGELDINLQLRPLHVILALACLAVVLNVTEMINLSMSADTAPEKKMPP